MDLRPQAHDIIRTWLFATIVRSHLEFNSLPWTDAAISGWILDPERKKMTKSKGNVVTPMGLLEQYGTDAVRYWSASGRPGADITFDDGQMRIGRKLAIKILNASRFVLETGAIEGSADPVDAKEVSEPIDRALLAALERLVEEVTVAFDGYDYARALERTEAFFWAFCDDYVELVKNRAYGTLGDDRARSARHALRLALSALLRLFAPVLPFVTEEVWSWWHEGGSIHRQPWPETGRYAAAAGEPALLDAVGALLSDIRKAKTAAGVSLRAEVASMTVTAPDDQVRLLVLAADDLRQAGVIADLRFDSGDQDAAPSVDVQLAEPA
jgi:valyl-tRNA synthetase